MVTTMGPRKVLLADDDPSLRRLVAATLGTENFDLLQATDGPETVTITQREHPDLVLLDLNMPGMNGIEATRRILQTHPQIGVIVITMLEDDDSVFAAMRAGARGYILKGADKAEMLRAIRAAARGEALFGPAIARRLMNFFHDLGAAPRPAQPPPAFPELTEREREILDLMAQGRSNPEIAARLALSPKTVSNHISNIFNKLQVADRARAIIRAREAGLGREGN